MKRIVKLDPFFTDQPEKTFIETLKQPLHAVAPANFNRRKRQMQEADANGLYLTGDFPDEKDLLDTSYADFARFAAVTGIAGKRYPITLKKGETCRFEAYSVRVTQEGAEIISADTEGIRRALVWLEGEMTAREGAFLPLGVTQRVPEMTLRITRCFFSPINRPPKYGDELSDDIDYYPDAYLNRLMHDGANAVWIYTRFSDLVSSRFAPEYGKGAASRIAKLNRVCEKCARYGIRCYVFAIEPVALPEALSQRIGDVDGGAADSGKRFFCVNSENGRAFVQEAGRALFEQCPQLGGFISITYGERATSCSSACSGIPAIGYSTPILCPRCRSLSPGQVLSNAVSALASGIHQANPRADVISWTYGHRFWNHEDVKEYVRCAPRDAILMQNFEEMGYQEQLGKTRQGVDYWLSYCGPSPLFRLTAQEAQKQDKRMFMKTQVCCSHEVATVPYVPVPGLLFDRYHAAHDLGVTGVMQCWYFGNYPSMMSRAAGELSFMRDFSDKRAFLERLAAIYWGQSRAKQVADAWEEFEKGYRDYPLNIMFSYYGPMHDGPVWELALKVKDYSLPRSWQTLDPTDGDRIGECLLSGHTLEEAITLCESMATHWEKGLAMLRALDCSDEAASEQRSVAEALGILFHSGLDILSFYQLRDRLGRGEGEPLSILSSLRDIVLREMRRSRELSALCEKDGRLGYHSEGEGYKYFPKKLSHRVTQLEKLLAEEFPEVEERIRNGLPPLSFYTGEEADYKHYIMPKGDIDCAAWEPIGKDAAFRASYDETKLVMEWRCDKAVPVDINAEFRLLWPACPMRILPDGEKVISPTAYLYDSVFGDKIQAVKDMWHTEAISREGLHIRATFDREAIGWTKDSIPMRMRFEIDGELWCEEENPIRTLGKQQVSPLEYGFLMAGK